MKVVIVEDEFVAAENLKFILNQIDSSIMIEAEIDTVADAVDYFKSSPQVDLAFFDIHLAEGISFEIFEQVEVNIPIIFTTAYDEYALKAFKVNSIDYLLKPINSEELQSALQKFKSAQAPLDTVQLLQAFKQISEQKKTYKQSYLVQKRDTLIPLKVSDVAFFSIEQGIVKAYTFSNSFFVIDEKLEDIEGELNPDQFFRANRQFIINREAIQNLKLYFNGKLIVNTTPAASEQIVVSKAKARLLKDWMN